MSAGSQAAAGFLGGLNSGEGLYNAVQNQPIQREALRAQLAQMQTQVPFTMPDGTVVNLPQNLAAGPLGTELYGQAIANRQNNQQNFDAGKLNSSEQTRLDATKSAIPLHNAMMALYQANQAVATGDPTVIKTAWSQLRQALASNPLTAPYAERLGDHPSNLAPVYNAIVAQSGVEAYRLSTGTVAVPGGPELKTLEATLFPQLADKPDVAYGKFQNYNNSFIQPAFDAAKQRIMEASDGQGNFTNPTLRDQYRNIVQDQTDANASLYNLPGFGPAGSPMPEIKPVLPVGGGGGTLRDMTPQPSTAAPKAPPPASAPNPLMPTIPTGMSGNAPPASPIANTAPGGQNMGAALGAMGITIPGAPQAKPTSQATPLGPLAPTNNGGGFGPASGSRPAPSKPLSAIFGT